MMRWQHYNFGGRAFRVRPVNLDLLQAGNVVAAALAESLGKSPPWAVGFFFGRLEFSLELFNVIAGISGIDE
jgi:hypothetical protein